MNVDRYVSDEARAEIEEERIQVLLEIERHLIEAREALAAVREIALANGYVREARKTSRMLSGILSDLQSIEINVDRE